MTQYATHVCPNCGRRIRCDQPLRTLEAQSPTLDSGTPSYWPNIEYQVYWGISKVTDALTKTLAVWIPVNAIMLGVSMRYEWTPVIPQIFSVASLAGLIRIFGKVPSWYNMIEEKPPKPEPQPEPEPEDTRAFIGWETETHTKTTQHMEWYTPPIPLKEARSLALAIVNRKFDWIAEQDLEKYNAKISGPHFRRLRQDWLARDWVSAEGKHNATRVINKHMIRRIAFDDPK